MAWAQLGADCLEAVMRQLLGRDAPWWERVDVSCEQRIDDFFGPVDPPQVARWIADDDTEAVELVCTLRSVCRAWRHALSYAFVQCMPLSLPADASMIQNPLADIHTFRLDGCTELPAELLSLRSLRVLLVPGYSAAQLPSWFARLPLASLSIGIVSNHAMAFCAWFRAHGQLPPSLRRLRVRAETCTNVYAGLSLGRFAHQLVSLSTRAEAFGGDYEWLATSAIVDLNVMRPEIGPLMSALQQMRVQALALYQEDDEESERAEQQLSEYLRSDAARASLTELSITGFGFPSALRGLRLRKLFINMVFGSTRMVHELSTIPSWIEEMPLVELAVTLRTLPTCLRSMSSLRFLELSNTYLSRPFDSACEGIPIGRYECVERASHAIRQVLVPLLDARPQLVVRILESRLSGDAIEEEQMRAVDRGWHFGIPGLLSGGEMGALLSGLAWEVSKACDEDLDQQQPSDDELDSHDNDETGSCSKDGSDGSDEYTL